MVVIEGVEFEWLGHDSFRIKHSGTIIYVDPYLISGGEPADLILVTHDHYDHCDPSSIRKIRKDSTVIISSPRGVGKLEEGKPLDAGESTTACGIEIRAVPAYNMGKPYHPEGSGVGFVFTVGGLRIYHCGDTDFIQEMEELGKIDVALLAIGGKYVMTEDEAVEAVRAIRPKYVIPMHYGTITQGDPARFKKMVGKAANVIIPK
jgi:L-ascorbate metabolism protein UlaG (beta-lactamase superfamily)